MSTMHRLAFWLPAFLAASQTSAQQAAQIDPSVRRGMMSTTPVGVVLASDSPSALLIADPGQGASPPAPWSVARFGSPDAAYPEYSLSALFDPSLAPHVVLAGVSTGNDWMPPIAPDGTLDMQSAPIWFGLTVSVTNASSGQAGSHVERVVAGGEDSPGAELFTYYAADSVGIDDSLPNTTVSERSRESLGLAAPATAPELRPDVAGLDHGLGVISFDPLENAGRMFAVRNRFFFALSPECIDDLGPDFAIDPAQPPVGGQPVTVPADAATIYLSRWTEVQASPPLFDWTAPEIYLSAATLGLDPGVDAIDAIAVDENGGRVIFSTQPTPDRDQLLAYAISWGGQPVDPQQLKASNGVPVSTSLGLTEASDVDGTCGIDPEHVFNHSGSVGIPRLSHDVNGTVPMGISVSRARAGLSGVDRFHVHVTGIDAALSGGLVHLYATGDLTAALAADPFGAPSPWLFLGSQPVAPGSTEVGWVFPGVSASVEVAVVAYLSSGSPADASLAKRGSWISFLEL